MQTSSLAQVLKLMGDKYRKKKFYLHSYKFINFTGKMVWVTRAENFGYHLCEGCSGNNN